MGAGGPRARAPGMMMIRHAYAPARRRQGNVDGPMEWRGQPLANDWPVDPPDPIYDSTVRYGLTPLQVRVRFVDEMVLTGGRAGAVGSSRRAMIDWYANTRPSQLLLRHVWAVVATGVPGP